MSILAGADAIADRNLGVADVGSSAPHHRHRASALRLETDLDAALRAFSKARFGEPLLASFQCEAFPTDFAWPMPASGLLDRLHRRSRAWAR